MMNKKSKTEEVLDGHVKTANMTFGARLRAYFLAGILVTAPISITLYVTYAFFAFIDQNVNKIIPDQWYQGVYGGTTLPGLGLVAAVVFFIVVGWFATNFFGRLFIRLAEYIVDRMPVIRTLYSAIKQIFETIMASKSQAFREVVMMEYPRKGVWSIGFVTGKSEGEVQRVTKEDTINVFVPTTPNPTSGYLLFVPRKELIFLDMSVEEGVKLVVSAGIITPPDRTKLKPKAAIAPKKVVKKAAKPKAKPKTKPKVKK